MPRATDHRTCNMKKDPKLINKFNNRAANHGPGFNAGMVFTLCEFTAECIIADSFTSHPSAGAGKLGESETCSPNRCNHQGRAFHLSSVRSIVFFMESTKGWQVVRENSRQWAQRSKFKWVNHVVPIIPDNHCVFCVATDDYVNISCNHSRNISKLSVLLCCQVRLVSNGRNLILKIDNRYICFFN